MWAVAPPGNERLTALAATMRGFINGAVEPFIEGTPLDLGHRNRSSRLRVLSTRLNRRSAVRRLRHPFRIIPRNFRVGGDLGFFITVTSARL